jgi:hypothetical protein
MFDEGNELTEKSLCFVKLVTKGATHGQITRVQISCLTPFPALRTLGIARL